MRITTRRPQRRPLTTWVILRANQSTSLQFNFFNSLQIGLTAIRTRVPGVIFLIRILCLNQTGP